MRILITVPSLAREFGGPAAKAQQLASALRATGDDVIVAGAGRSEGGRTLGLTIAGRFHATPVPWGTRKLRRLVGGSDVVHVLGFRDPVGTAAAFAAARAGVPYLLEPVGMHTPRLRSLRLKAAFDRSVGDRVVRRAAAVVATSRLEAGELRLGGIDADAIRLRPNGIDVEPLLPLPERGGFRATHGVPADAPMVLALGRVTAKKGLPMLAEAVGGLEGTWLAVVGPDDGDGTLGELRRTARDLGVVDRLVIAGGAWGADKAAAFVDADAFALPSATENFGNAAAEAAALGLPVVVSDRCGVAEWLPPTSSVVVPFGDTGALRTALVDALGDACRAQAREHASSVRDALSWAGIARTQRAMYEDLCDASTLASRGSGP